MSWSQENCLIDNHRLTCERWEGDLDACPNVCTKSRQQPRLFYTTHSKRRSEGVADCDFPLRRFCFDQSSKGFPLPVGKGSCSYFSSVWFAVALGVEAERGGIERFLIFFCI